MSMSSSCSSLIDPSFCNSKSACRSISAVRSHLAWSTSVSSCCIFLTTADLLLSNLILPFNALDQQRLASQMLLSSCERNIPAALLRSPIRWFECHSSRQCIPNKGLDDSQSNTNIDSRVCACRRQLKPHAWQL